MCNFKEEKKQFLWKLVMAGRCSANGQLETGVTDIATSRMNWSWSLLFDFESMGGDSAQGKRKNDTFMMISFSEWLTVPLTLKDTRERVRIICWPWEKRHVWPRFPQLLQRMYLELTKYHEIHLYQHNLFNLCKTQDQNSHGPKYHYHHLYCFGDVLQKLVF